jgi:FeS assembly SUF system protein
MSNDRELDNAADFLSAEPSDPARDARQTELDTLGERITQALRTVYDPEIPVNIFELGLIYKIDIDDANHVHLDMTLTSPACPVAGILPDEVKTKVEDVEGVSGATVELVWDPPWHPGMMTEEAQLELGIIY